MINTNLNSCFNVTRPVIEGMRERKWGRIVQISSINGQKGQYGQANYAAAKAGMHGFTISLAQENARFGITVNTVSPGYVGTDMVMAVPEDVRAKIVAQIPIGRLGKPEEIAYAVSFLILGGIELDHRLEPGDQWRALHGLVSLPYRHPSAGRGPVATRHIKRDPARWRSSRCSRHWMPA